MKVLLLPALLSATLAAQQRNPFHGSRDAAEAGRGMFRIYCSPCHGIGAQGGRAPDLTGGTYSVGNTDDAIFRVISEGASGTEMPGFSERFNAEGVWRLVTYLRSVSGKAIPPPSGDRTSGEQYFWGKGNCGSCHRVGGRGSRMGPDLTLAGRQRSLSYLKESITDPNAILTPGYNTITVVDSAGRKIVGVQKGYDAFTAQLMDMSENFHSFAREEVKSMTREFKSLMPAYQLAGTELDNLLVYLSSLKGK